MVKLDNWETKASRAAERRSATKQRKQKREKRRSNKQRALQLLSLLDYYGEKLLAQKSSSVEVHLWTDSMPIGFSLDDLEDTNGRPRGYSDASEKSEYSEGDRLSMCCSHFFSGKCSGFEGKSRKKGKGKGRCVHGLHLTDSHQSLYHALLVANENCKDERKVDVSRSGLQLSRDAVEKSHDGLSPKNKQIDMLYPLSYVTSATSNISLANGISFKLASTNCPIASIVYVVMDGLIVYDRNRDGIVVSTDEEEILLRNCPGEGLKRRSVSIGDDPNNKGTCDPSILIHHQNLVQHLPSQVLEYLILFLPDSAAAMLPLVCKSWNKEIGRSSPDLWKKLLKRRCWPETLRQTDVVERIQADFTERDFYRKMFVSHYSAARDIDALSLGLKITGMIGGNKSINVPLMRDIAFLHAKDNQSHCGPRDTLVQMFSAATALVANCNECILSLFETIETSGQSTQRCKKSLSVSVSPFFERNWRIVAIALDEDKICCLYDGESNKDSKKFIGTIDRNDLLCVESGGTAASKLERDMLNLFDLEDLVLDYLLVCDEDEVTRWLDNHLSSDMYDSDPFQIDIKNNLVACGNGKFLFEAAISLQLHFNEDDDDMDLMSSALVKVFLFSEEHGEITWVGPKDISGASTVQFWYPLRTSLVGNGMYMNDYGQYSEIAFMSRASTDIATIRVSSDGYVNSVKVGRHVGLSDSIDNRGRLWRRSPEFGRCISVTPSDVIIAECYQSTTHTHLTHRVDLKTIFSFYPIDSKSGKTTNLMVDGNCVRTPIKSIRSDYIVAFSQERSSDPDALHILLIYVPSRKVIHKACVVNFQLINAFDLIKIDTQLHSIVLSLRNGLLLVGQDVRELTKKAGKKKKKGRHERKKDVYARGMRQSLG